MVGPDKRRSLDSGCFQLLSSHQQGIHIIYIITCTCTLYLNIHSVHVYIYTCTTFQNAVFDFHVHENISESQLHRQYITRSLYTLYEGRRPGQCHVHVYTCQTMYKLYDVICVQAELEDMDPEEESRRRRMSVSHAF